MTSELRNDLNLTSTGKAHYYQSAHGFPPDGFRRTVYDVLPPVLGNPDNVTDKDYFQTTTGTTHDYKAHGGTLGNMLFKKAPGSWKVHYVEDNIGKLSVKPWRRPLTMGNQCSEMKSQYTGRPGVNLDTAYNAGIQPFNLADHHREGNSKDLVPSTINRGIAGQKFYPRDRGVLTYHMDPYLTTTQKDHRAFTKHELGRYPSKDYATYWECEEYTKAWGHGSKDNPLPPNSVPREKGPMRDRIWFREPTTIPRLPKSLTPVPNNSPGYNSHPKRNWKQCLCKSFGAQIKCIMGNVGMKTLMTQSYTMPLERKRWELFSLNVPKPWHAPLESPGPGETFRVPRMYSTEYQFYGSEKPVTV